MQDAEWIKGFRGIGLIVLAACLFAAGSVQATDPGAEALLGTWQGELSVDRVTHLVVQFIVARTDQNHYSAVLNAPDEANLRNIPVTTFDLTGDKVVFVVDEVNGNYEGLLKDRKITGKWQQNGASFDLNLTPYVKAKLSPEMIAHLSGPWNGVLSIPKTDRTLALVLNFKPDPKNAGGMTATIDSPDQSVFGIPADDVSFEDGNVSVDVARPKMGFKGKLAGDQLVGQWIQGGAAPLSLHRGEYRLAGLEVEQSLRTKLSGNWYGEFSNGTGIALKFHDAPNGKLDASLDSPYEGRHGIPITAISQQGSALILRIDGIGATFKGSVMPNEIRGTLTAGGQDRAINFKRGDYVPEALHVPTELAAKLLGKWEGKAANTNMTLRFQLDDRGNLVAQQDIPNRQLFGLPVSDVVLRGEQLSLTVKGIAAEFKGKLANNEISGDWTMPSLQFPLRFVKTQM
jgi:hypothetical protein